MVRPTTAPHRRLTYAPGLTGEVLSSPATIPGRLGGVARRVNAPTGGPSARYHQRG